DLVHRLASFVGVSLPHCVHVGCSWHEWLAVNDVLEREVVLSLDVVLDLSARAVAACLDLQELGHWEVHAVVPSHERLTKLAVVDLLSHRAGGDLHDQVVQAADTERMGHRGGNRLHAVYSLLHGW